MAKNKSLFVSIVAISSLGIVAKVLGLLREGVVAAYFGTSAQMDVFSLLSSIMTTLITIFASSASISYLPIFVKDSETSGVNNAAVRLSNILNQYIVYSVLFYLLLFFVAPLAPNFIGGSAQSVDNDTIVLYTRLLFSTIIASGFSRIQLAALSGLKDYGWLQKTTAIYSLISIALTLFFGRKYGVGVLVAAYVLNSIIQLIILQLVLQKHNCKYSFYINFRDKEINNVWKTTFPVFLGTEVYMLGLTIDRTIGSTLGVEGVVSAFNYSGVLYGLINTIISGPIITVFYTELSQNYVSGIIEKFYNSINKTITLLAIILLPIAFFLCVDAREFVVCALRRGAFNDNSVDITHSIFRMYVLISPIYALRILLSRVYLIMGDSRTPMHSGIIFLIVNVCCGYLLSVPFGAFGITIGAIVAMAASTLFLMNKLRKKHSCECSIFSVSSKKAAMIAIVDSVVIILFHVITPTTNVYLSFLVDGFLYVLVYLCGLKLTRVPEYSSAESRVITKVKSIINT